MDRDKLKETLAKLHGELAAADRMDVESAQMLHEAIDDINGALERTGETIEKKTEETHDRLENLAVRFDMDHPRLASLVRQLNAALSRIGI